MHLSKAERLAEDATKRAPFAVNLSDVKSTVTEILSQVGRFNFFNELTPHNIKHIDEMLALLDWIVPETTASIMSPADWFMIVMSAYFHDLGLLITREEFSQRDQTDFELFCEQNLFSGDRGQDYRQRVAEMDQPRRDEFLYQEFVRAKHGQRIRAWIMNAPMPELGTATAAIQLIDDLLRKLDPLVRRDLATICESHTLGDLSDFKKYPIERPYDNSLEDTANLHYCALLLRTIDLLQITRDRAPTTMFRLIDPSDPVSQAEWSKQNAVKRLKQKELKPRDAREEQVAQPYTIEVFANFSSEDNQLNENGYFALTSYLAYAEKELGATFQVAQVAITDHGSKYHFPWRFIDTTNVEAEGFLKDQFEFSIDQSRILDLLTGHTLYNNSLVVLRELVQNSLDAVRLFARMAETGEDIREAAYEGNVSISWESQSRLLEIRDNGTGMSQDVIVKHLLKVGSSRYQGDSFKKQFPDFAPISRFGIGVLTAFMVADSVDIMTSEINDPQVRQISLRSVHGKYLIRL
jgi:molecular chaperone HtpG